MVHMFHTPRVVQFLSQCQHQDGGFAGGPGQLAHLAPTYAAILTLAILGTQEAYNCIDRWVGSCAGLCIVLWVGLEFEFGVCTYCTEHLMCVWDLLDMVTIMRWAY